MSGLTDDLLDKLAEVHNTRESLFPMAIDQNVLVGRVNNYINRNNNRNMPGVVRYFLVMKLSITLGTVGQEIRSIRTLLRRSNPPIIFPSVH